MMSELECGICYRFYDGGRRCPRQLQCKHSFCESCLLTLAAQRSDEAQASVTCAFCRHTSTLTQERLRDNFPVDEDILERLVEAGALEGSPSDDDEDEEQRKETNNQCKDEDLTTSGKGPVWRFMKRLYKKVRGSNQQGCMTNAEMRHLALMSYYIM